MVKILHFADVHLGMENFGHLDAISGLHSRVMDFLNTLDAVCDFTEDEKPDLILFCGDAFRNRTPNPTLVTHFASRLQRLATVAPVVMVVGNHDWQRSGSEKKHSVSIYPELNTRHKIYVLDEIASINIDGTAIITFPWLYDTNMEDAYDKLEAALEHVRSPCILTGHCTVEGAVTDVGYEFTGRDSVYPISTFCDACWDYVALGHIHKHQCLCKTPPVVYSGSMDRIDWGEREGAKGFVLADVQEGSASWEFIDCEVRPMLDLRVKYAELDSLSGIDCKGAIVRITVRCAKPVIYSAVADKVGVLLRDAYLIDNLSIDSPDRERFRRLERGEDNMVSSLSTMELLKIYLDDKHPGKPKTVRKLLRHAKAIMEAHDGTERHNRFPKHNF